MEKVQSSRFDGLRKIDTGLLFTRGPMGQVTVYVLFNVGWAVRIRPWETKPVCK